MAEGPAQGAAPGLLVLGPTSAFVFGFTSGVVSSSKLASKQFLAENAHRLPTTVQGWYFYQKTKNYRVMFAGLKGGFKTGARLGLWTGAFLGVEQAVDAGLRQAVALAGRKADDVKTTWAAGGVAGLVMAAAAGWVYRLPRASAGRRYFYGLALGAIAGGAIDVRDWMKERLQKAA